MNNSLFITAAEAAERFGVSRWTITAWVREGRLRATRLGKRTLRFRVTDLESYANRRTSGGDTDAV